MTVKVKGDRAMVNLLKQLPNKMARTVGRGALVASAKPIIKQYKQNLAPFKRTGLLAKSVKAKPAGKERVGPDDEVSVLVGPTGRFFYGGFLEFGTSRITAEHPFRDALDTTRDQQIKILAAEVGKRVKKQIDKLRKK